MSYGDGEGRLVQRLVEARETFASWYGLKLGRYQVSVDGNINKYHSVLEEVGEENDSEV